MTSTNDRKDVKSYQISGPKSKTYFIELYKSLDARLSGECSGEERARLVCESWRRVHSLCQHSAPTTQLHLINWLQQHTAHTILQTEWQSPKSKNQHSWLEQAINEFIQECQNAVSKREGGFSPPWEHQLQLRALWFRSTLPNPWGHSVLKALLDSKGTQPSDDEVLEWLKLERAVMFVTRLRQLAASKCDDLALLLATAVMDKMRAATVTLSDVEQAETRDNPELLNNKESTFVNILRDEAGFTEEVWMLITDIEFVLLYKGQSRSRCIELAKQTPLRAGYQLVKRLYYHLERSPRDKKLWKNAKEAATLVAQVVIARCMVVPRCVGAARGALAGCAGLLALLLAPARLRTAAVALAQPATTSRHLYTLAEAVHERCKDERTQFVCELYVRAITAGMNELERLKIKTEKESEARATEKTLSSWFSKLGGLLSASRRLYCECILTAFSVHPSLEMYERVQAAPVLAALKTDIQETNEETNSEYGSWATDSRTQTNFVKTSETLNLKKTQKQANVLSTAIFAEGETLGLGAELCQDLAVLISGPRVKTLSWDTDRAHLLESCRLYCERTGGGTRALTHELRFLNLDPSSFQHLPEEPDDDGDLYYGIEKGYEHLVDLQEPEDIWQDAASDDASESGSAPVDSPPAPRKKKNKTKRLKYSSDEESEWLSLEAMAKSSERKERPHSKERNKERKEKKYKTKVKQETKDGSVGITQGSELHKKKKERKERKREKDTRPKPIVRPSVSLSRLVGMKVAGLSQLNSNLDGRSDGNINILTDGDCGSQGKPSLASLNAEGNAPDVLFDGLFSMDDIKSPEKNVNDNIQRANISKMEELKLTSGSETKYGKLQSTSYQSPLVSSNVNHVREDVKNSIKKLIEFRRYKNINIEPLNRTDSNTQRPTYEQQSQHNTTPVPALNTHSVSKTNSPKVFIHQEQIKQLNALKDEVNSILKNTSFGIEKNGLIEAPEKLMPPNTITKRPIDRPKKLNQKYNLASRSFEQEYKLKESVSSIPPQGLLERHKRVVETNQDKHHEIIKHLEKSPNKIIFQDNLKTRLGQTLEKTETAIQNNYQSIPQHISNSSPSSLHTKVNTLKTVSHNPQQCPSKTVQHQPIPHKHDPSQQQFHNFLKDLQVSINAGACNDKKDSKVSPTQTSTKQTINQKKSDNVPITFARMSYLKNKQTDLKSKSMDRAVQNKCIQGEPNEKPQNFHPKGQFFITKVDKTKFSVCKEKDQIKLESRDNNPKVKIEMTDVKQLTTPLSIAKKHPTMSNILSNRSQKHIFNTSASALKYIETIQPVAPERTSFLSEKDQDDMRHLLRQQSLLNSMKGQRKTDILKSSVNSVTISNNKMPLIINPDGRPYFSENDIKINISEPINANEKSIPNAVLKVSNAKAASEAKKSPRHTQKSSDWESVMNALLATKTPTRVSQSGPNALDIALNKDSFERCYSSNLINHNQKKIHPTVITETLKNNPAISIHKPISDIKETPVTKSLKKCEINSKDKEHISNMKPQSNPRLLPASKPIHKPKPICVENLSDLSKKHIFHGPAKPLPSVIQNKNDPFISGIKNSDYDLLEELMDDDLRQEIGELSDEEPYNVPLPVTTKCKNTLKTSNVTKKYNPDLNKSLYVHQQRNTEQIENTYKPTDFNFKDAVKCHSILKPVKKCTLSTNNLDRKLRIISNEVISPGNVNNNINYFPVINNTVGTVRESNEIKNHFHVTPKKANGCVSNKITSTVINPDSKVKIDNQATNLNINKIQKSQLNILDPARVVLTVPPRHTQPNVMLIGNDFLYDSFSTIHLEQTNVNGNASNFNNHNTYIAVNQVPKVTVFHTTQFAASVVNPVLIENSIVLPVHKNTNNTNNVTPEVSQSTSSLVVHGEIKESIFSQNGLKTDTRNDIPIIEPIISKLAQELFPKPTDIKQVNDSNQDNETKQLITECDIQLNVSKSNSREITERPHKHNTCNADQNRCSVSHIPISVIVSSENHGTLNTLHSDRQMNDKSSMPTITCNQNIIKDNQSQKAVRVKTVKEEEEEERKNTVTPMSHVKHDTEKTDLNLLEYEEVVKRSKLTNQGSDRINQKRLRILKRNIEYRCHDKPIALSYKPIKPKHLNEGVNLKNKDSIPSVEGPKDIELSKPMCRRILLRSSNSLSITKSKKTETLVRKLKSKHVGVKMGKTKIKHNMKPFSKQFKNELQKTDSTAKTIKTCDIKRKNLNSVQKSSLSVCERFEDSTKTEKLNVVNEKTQNKIDICNTNSVEESIESSVTPVSEIKKAELLPLPEEVAGSDIRQSDSIVKYCENSIKIPEVSQNNIKDSTKLDTNTLRSKNEKIKSISIEDQISTNNNNNNNVVKDSSDKNQKLKDAFKEKIFFEELPNLDDDQSKRYIRIKLPNGSFKATISGKVNVNIDSILEDPSIKAMLREKMNCKTKCILNIKQIAVQSKNRPSVIKTHIQDVSYVIKDDLETINLISDDDEDIAQLFETEFGSFKMANMESKLYTKHQKKLSQRCVVRIERSKINKNDMSDITTENTTNSIIPVESICTESLDITKKNVDFIEIDDSSNESVNLMSTLDSTIIKNSEVETKLNVSNLNIHIGLNIKENEPEVSCNMPETHESSQNVTEFELKDCSLKIEKCDKLIKQYEQLTIKNKKCFVNLVRCDSPQNYRKKTAEAFSDLKSTEESSPLFDVLNVNEELSEICEQSLKRVDSMSILNDLSTSGQDFSRGSPSVIEEFDMFAVLTENTNSFNDINANTVIDFLPLDCFADWVMTKSRIRGIGQDTNTACKLITLGVDKTYFTSDDISTDCDSDRESNPASDEFFYEESNFENKNNIFQAPSLLQIIIDFFASNIHIIESLKSSKSNSKYQYVSRYPSLKRKQNDFKDNKNRNKICKLENKPTLLDFDCNIKELVTKQDNGTLMPVKNKPKSLNKDESYSDEFYKNEVESAGFTMELDKQDEQNESNNDTNSPICDIKKCNTTPETVALFKPLQSEKIIENKRTKSNENNMPLDNINMNVLDCPIKQDIKIDCVNVCMEQPVYSDVTKPLVNKISILKCKEGGRKNNHSANPCIKLPIVSTNHIEKLFDNLNYANETKNTQENCNEKDDENITLSCKEKLVSYENLIILSNGTALKENPGESTSAINVNSPSSSTKNDFVYNIEMVNIDTAPDVILNKNTSDEIIIDDPLKEFDGDHHSSGILIKSNTNNINIKIDKIVDSGNSYECEDLLNREEIELSLTESSLKYSSSDNMDIISHETNIEKQIIDTHLNIGNKIHSSLEPQNDVLLSVDNNESVTPTSDMRRKVSEDSDAILSDEIITNFKERHSKLEINPNYPCTSENSQLPCRIDGNTKNVKSIVIETSQITEDEFEIAGSLEKFKTETIVDLSSNYDDTLNENSKINTPLENVKQTKYFKEKLNKDKIIDSPCLSKTYNISYNEDYNDSDSQDLTFQHLETQNGLPEIVIPFEEIISSNVDENIFDKTNCDQIDEINKAFLDDNKDKEKDNVCDIPPEETLKSVVIKVLPLSEVPETINMKSIGNSSIPKNIENEQCDLNISEIKKINELSPSLTYQNNHIVDKEETPSVIADCGVESNSIIKVKKEKSCLSGIYKIDLDQKQVFDVLNEIGNENVDNNNCINNISSEKPKQENVTLVYKGDSSVVLEDSIYEDPVVGTCYIFPLLNRTFLPDDILSSVSNDKSISVLQHFKNKVMEDNLKKDEIDDECFNFNTMPKVTYVKGRLKNDNINNPNVKKNKRNLKRKMDYNDKQSGKKYRKGKNIDYPKLTATAINKAAYTKEYKRIFDYCNTITFSYSRPFHIEHIDVYNLLKSWPIKGITVDNTDQTDFKNVLFIDEDVHKIPYDPLQQTFSEEISNYNDQQYSCSNIIENNFSMGFGEGSDRVIDISKDDEGNISKFSAATLSDVKQAQPFLMSSHHETSMRTARVAEPYIEQKEVFKRYLTYIKLKEKVRSFFQNTTLELNKSWLTDNKINSNKLNFKNRFPYELTCPDYISPVPFQCVVQVVQVGQLPVNAAQNPVTCDPRVTQVTDASPSQCSGENSPHDSQSPIKTEYTELTTADISIPLVQEYERHIEAQESSKALLSLDNIPVETEIKSEIKDEIPDFENDQNGCNENNVLQTLVNKHINNIEYPYESTDCSEELHTQINTEIIYEQEVYNSCDFIAEQKKQDSPLEKTDQIAHAMNAAGITTTSEAVSNSRAVVNVLSQNICQEVANNYPTSTNSLANKMTLQQALSQILPPPLNPTSQESNQSSTNTSLTSQVLHIVQGKNSNGNQITLVDNSQNSVISNSNTPMLHIVQSKGSHTNSTSNTNAGQPANTFGGLSLVDSSLQQGNNQVLHIVNAGNQKANSSGQLLKRVNLVTNLTNTQGSNEQKVVQFVCKSADGKSIQLNAPHQRGMVLRLQPIETNIQNSPKPTDSQELSPVSNGNNNSSTVKEVANTQHEIKSRSVYEENYAKFIQNSNKTVNEKSTTLPKFNQAFGKQVFQDNNQKANDLNSNNSHLSINSTESSECQGPDSALNIDHIGQISSPPLILRKSPAQTSQAQSNLVQQIKQTIAPVNIQTMHGGVIYTRQIPVNIGGGQTINLITVPSTELLENDNQKQQGEVKFINQSDIETPIIKIVPHGQNNSSVEGSTDDGNNHNGMTNENGQATPTQHQPVLTQMRIKLPMLSKTPQMVSGTRVVRPSFFQIQRNVIGGANQPVYQQLVLTAAPPLSQHIRLPQAQTTRQVKVNSDGQSSSESQMSTSTLEQLREFDMVLEQVKERSTVQPNPIPNSAFAKLHSTSSDTTDGSSVTSTVTESTQQVLYSIGNNQSLNVAYVNRKPNPTFVRSPDSSGIIDSPSSSTHIQIPHTVTSESASNDVSTQPSQPKAAKVGSKSKSRPKSSSNSSNSIKINAVPPKTSTQKPLEDEQTTQRILYILAEYKEQVENSPDKDKPAPRRRSNPPSNTGSSKRKKSSSGSRRSGMRDMSPVHGEDTCRTMGSEDSSCGTSQGDCNDSCLDSHSPQDSPRKVVRKLTFDSETTTASQSRPQPQRNVIVADGQTITVARGASGKPTTAVLMPANYILPVSMVKGGQQIAIVTNRGPKILTVGGGEGGTTNALLLQRLIGPAGLKPVLTRPGVRHVRLPTAALHNLQAFNLATATFQQPDSTASPAPGSTPPELIETTATSSPWADRDSQEVKPERGSSPEDTEPWNLPSSADPHDYSYEETVQTDNMDRTVLDAIPDRYSPDTEAQRIFDKMFDVDTKRSYIIDSQDDSRCAYDIDTSDCDDKAYHQVVQRRDGSRHHRFAHVTHAAAMRHKYAILEHELRLQKSLSEECEDLGVDSPSASELFPEAELLFGTSPAHEAQQHSHTPQPTVLSQCGIPQPDIDDQIATDHLLQHEGLDDQQDLGVTLGLDEGIVTVSEDGMQATIALDQEEFARSHPNTTFHSEPTEDGEIQPFIVAGLKGRHITSTVFHATRAPATVLVSAPPPAPAGPPAGPPVAAGRATHVIRRAGRDRRDGGLSAEEAGGLAAGDDGATTAEDVSRDAEPESPAGDDCASSPERHADPFWESNSTSERSEGGRPPDYGSDGEKCRKSPSYDETDSTDSGGGALARLDSVIKDARGLEPGGADGSSADDAPRLRTYPPQRTQRARERGAGQGAGRGAERSLSGKTRAGERRRAGCRACRACAGSPAPPRTKRPRHRKHR